MAMQLCVRNTFINILETRKEPDMVRSRSAPLARRRQQEAAEQSPERSRAMSFPQPPPEDCASGPEALVAEDAAGTVSTASLEQPIIAMKGLVADLHAGAPAAALTPKYAASAAPGLWRSGQEGQQVGKDPSSSLSPRRWWEAVQDVCPLSSFPISLLPYPPYKFNCSAKDRDGQKVVKLVDGPYLVLEVLAEWNFNVLGRPLDERDVRELDSYVRRCKLGPFRLEKALGLAVASSLEPRAMEELRALRQKAKERLLRLRQIQRQRLQRECNERQTSTPAVSPATQQQQLQRRQLKHGKWAQQPSPHHQHVHWERRCQEKMQQERLADQAVDAAVPRGRVMRSTAPQRGPHHSH